MTVTAVALPPALEEGVIVWDPLGGVLSANAAAERSSFVRSALRSGGRLVKPPPVSFAISYSGCRSRSPAARTMKVKDAL